MEKIGVEAVVTGLVEFLSSMNKIDSSITDLSPKSSLLAKGFQMVGNVVEWLTGSVFRVLEYTLGSLISSAIQSVVRSLKELIAGTIEAGNEFQTLQIRLQNFNLNAATESGMEFQDAMKVATEQTQEQLTWLQRLAAQTPYDLTDIANVYTLARSYGFASGEAQTLTARIADFAAGMGLGNTEIERIVVNFGQMVQQGKVTQREMNDLARGAFVPVNDVLKLMQEQTGLTGDAFDDFRNSAEGVNAFMLAFNTLVEQRFVGSTTAMARTWKGATDNIKDFVKSIIGLDVVKPVLDTLGGYVANFLDAFTRMPSDAERAVAEMEGITIRDPFEEITATAKTIGKTISGIITDILGLGPSADDLALRLVDGVKAFSDWLIAHKGDIVEFVKNTIKSVQDFASKVKSFIDDKIVPAFDRISGWVTANKGTIEEFFKTVGSIISEFFSDLMGQPGKPAGGDDILGSLLDGLKSFMDFVIENRDAILKWVEIIWSVIAVFTVLNAIGNIVVKVVISIAAIVLFAISAWNILAIALTGVGVIFSLLISIITAVGLPVVALIALVVALAAIWKAKGDEIGNTAAQLLSIMQYYSTQIVKWVSAKFDELFQFVQTAMENTKTAVASAFDNMVSTTASSTGSMLSAIIVGFASMLSAVISKMIEIYNTVRSKFDDVKAAILNVGWSDVGVNIIEGIIGGIESMVGSLVDAAGSAATAAVTAVSGLLQINSPSKVFYEIGKNTILGMVEGIAATSSMLSGAMRGVTAATIAQGSAIPSALYSRMAPSQTSTVNNTSNFSMTVNTAARHEDIVADFNMLQSLNG